MTIYKLQQDLYGYAGLQIIAAQGRIYFAAVTLKVRGGQLVASFDELDNIYEKALNIGIDLILNGQEYFLSSKAIRALIATKGREFYNYYDGTYLSVKNYRKCRALSSCAGLYQKLVVDGTQTMVPNSCKQFYIETSKEAGIAGRAFITSAALAPDAKPQVIHEDNKFVFKCNKYSSYDNTLEVELKGGKHYSVTVDDYLFVIAATVALIVGLGFVVLGISNLLVLPVLVFQLMLATVVMAISCLTVAIDYYIDKVKCSSEDAAVVLGADSNCLMATDDKLTTFDTTLHPKGDEPATSKYQILQSYFYMCKPSLG